MEEEYLSGETDLLDMYRESSKSFLGMMPGTDGIYEKKTIEYYRMCLENKTILRDMVFSMMEKHVGLWNYEGTIKIMMPLAETVDVDDTTVSELYVSSDHLNRSYSVLVYDVNEEENIVLVSFVRARNLLRPAKIEEIRRALLRGETPRVRARVTKLCEATPGNAPQRKDAGRIRMVYIDIWGLGIHGRIHERDFLDGYVPDMRFFIGLNDIVWVNIFKEGSMIKNGRRKARFECSKKDAEESPWDYMDLKNGMRIRVCCLTIGRRSENGTYGSALLDDGNRKVVCRYYAPRNIRAEVGKEYIARVKNYDRAEKRLTTEILFACGRDRVYGQ